MSKVTKFLDSKAIKLESCSHSIYYEFYGKTIRVSDHLEGKGKCFDINIILPKNKAHTYILSLNGQLFIHDSFTSLKLFLESFFLIIESGIDKVKAVSDQNSRSLQKELGIVTTKYNRLKSKYDSVLLLGDKLITSQLTAHQIDTIQSWISTNKLNKAKI